MLFTSFHALFLFFKLQKKKKKCSMLRVQLYKCEADTCWSCCHPASPGWMTFCMDLSSEPACLPATHLLVPEEGQTCPPTLSPQLQSQDCSNLHQLQQMWRFINSSSVKENTKTQTETSTNPKILHYHWEPELNMNRSIHWNPSQPTMCCRVSAFPWA